MRKAEKAYEDLSRGISRLPVRTEPLWGRWASPQKNKSEREKSVMRKFYVTRGQGYLAHPPKYFGCPP